MSLFQSDHLEDAFLSESERVTDQGESAALLSDTSHKERYDQYAETPARFSTLLMLTWVFALMSIVGLVGETLQHFVFSGGEWESRAGFIWGPFSPIYGFAAFLLTYLALQFEDTKDRSALAIFFTAAFIGGAIEYLTSWAMETFWGIVAWSYLEIPGNFNGRTDIFHMILWGALGLVWVRLCYPFVKRQFTKINTTGITYRVISWALFAFLVCDACMTAAVMLRADARTHGVEASTPIEEVLDEFYPNETLQARFQNMGGIGRAD